MAGVKGRSGGARANAGRPKGGVNKIQGGDFLKEYRRVHGEDLVTHLAQDMYDARQRGDRELLYRYHSAFAKYFFTDVAAQDITSAGKSIAPAQVMLVAKELDDWKDEDK